MKKWLTSLGILVVTLLAITGLSGPQSAQAAVQDFTITSFTADYYLTRNQQKTSLLRVEETIIADFPSFDQNHGILRAIPKTYQGHTLSLRINSVTNQSGQSYAYTASAQNDNLVLKIGDADRFVHGPTTYKINYEMRNVTAEFDDHDEFYWDVNGDQWPQVMGVVTARTHIPAGLASGLQNQQRCFAGVYGSNAQNGCSITRASKAGETVVTVAASNVQPYSTLTFVLGFDQDTFVPGPEIVAARRQALIKRWLLVGSVVGPPLLTALIMFDRWRKFGRDPKGKGVIVAQYQPPKDANALSSSFVLNEHLLPQAISAGVIELAVQRYLDITEIKTKKLIRTYTDYELTLVKDPLGLSEEQLLMMNAFFGSAPAKGAVIRLSKLKNKLASSVRSLDSALGTSQTARGYFAQEPIKARKKHAGWGLALILLGILLLFTGLLSFLGAGLVLSGIIILAFSNKMPARTRAGVERRDYLLGLKEFIKVVEEKRFAYLQTPEGAEKTGLNLDPKNTRQKVNLFEELLPYAMLFGLEKAWAKEFADIYTEPPAWYHGNYATFNTAYLLTSLNGVASASTVAFTAPSSSGSSGFGGGGFSGGGGGGGGGGGW